MAAPNPAGHTLISATNQIATSAAKITIYGCSTSVGGMSHRITDWDPEDVPAWEAGNKNIARRNLIW